MSAARLDIARRRLITQQIAQHAFTTPAEVVAWLGAVQSQDYAGGKWAIGLRLPRATDAAIERAIAERTIVRTWPMRATLHFVAAADVRWMLELLANRMPAGRSAVDRQLEIDATVIRRARRVITAALRGGRQRTRADLYQELDGCGIATGNVGAVGRRGLHILGRLAREGVICLGTRAGKQQTFVLLDEWLPGSSPPLPRDEALARLALRYFTGHGPATLQDFVWWSGLGVRDARAALAMVTPQLACEEIDGAAYWSADAPKPPRAGGLAAQLLPPFDEYLVGYRDRTAALDPAHIAQAPTLLSPTIVLGGRVAGTWGRRTDGRAVRIRCTPFRPLTASEQRGVDAAIARYTAFVADMADGSPASGRDD